MRMIIVVATLSLLAGCMSTGGSYQDAKTEAAPVTTPPAEASIRYEHTCDMLLFTGGGKSSFVGVARLVNSGDVPADVRVIGSWVQVGSKPLTAEKTVTVPAGGRKTVNLKILGGQSEVAAYQAGYDLSHECRVTAKVLD